MEQGASGEVVGGESYVGEQAGEEVRGGSREDEEEDEGVRAGEFGEAGARAGGDALGEGARAGAGADTVAKSEGEDSGTRGADGGADERRNEAEGTKGSDERPFAFAQDKRVSSDEHAKATSAVSGGAGVGSRAAVDWRRGGCRGTWNRRATSRCGADAASCAVCVSEKALTRSEKAKTKIGGRCTVVSGQKAKMRVPRRSWE